MHTKTTSIEFLKAWANSGNFFRTVVLQNTCGKLVLTENFGLSKPGFFHVDLIDRSLNINGKSNHKRCSIKKAVLKIFAIFTGKHLRRSLFLTKKISILNFIEKRVQHSCFPVNIAKFVRKPIL